MFLKLKSKILSSVEREKKRKVNITFKNDRKIEISGNIT